MDERRPSYWRAFWITAAIVGGINIALFAYIRYLPEAPIGKGGRMMKPIPEWSLPVIVINLPGAVVMMPFWIGQNEPQSELAQAVIFGGMQAISTVFWGCVAVAVEWFSFGRRRFINAPAQNPGIPAESK